MNPIIYLAVLQDTHRLVVASTTLAAAIVLDYLLLLNVLPI